ncbi:hypothetical protein [Flammeovirga aprica]|uniref:Uncharacterized protein n=1 Tax=Flammeovirga aprica JL-4 TaxID=694437 RepID=A0A7X9XCC2_9BACT|nr:hypothetical protein [Flammeovirga aprica]NME71593.1 hypothetical protein [Flammeovirga aprica JL-4]
MDFYTLLSIITSLSFLYIGFINCIISNQISIVRLNNWYVGYLGFLLAIEGMTLSSIYILESETMQNIYPIYVTGEFFITINLLLSDLKVKKLWYVISGIIALSFGIEACILWLSEQDPSTGYGKIISHLIIICFSAFLLIKNIKDLKKNNPGVIVYAFLFLYYSVTLFLFMVMDQLTEQNFSIWIMNNLLNTVLYVSFIYTFYSQIKWSLKSNL